MNIFSEILHTLPEDVQRRVLDQVPRSYAVWVDDHILFVDCNLFADLSLEDNLHFIRLCVDLGWVSQAILSTVKKGHTHFWGSRLTTYTKVTFDDVKPILIALDSLPYTFDEEYCQEVDPTFTPVLSSNVPDPPYHSGPYRRYSYPEWNPRLECNYPYQPWRRFALG